MASERDFTHPLHMESALELFHDMPRIGSAVLHFLTDQMHYPPSETASDRFKDAVVHIHIDGDHTTVNGTEIDLGAYTEAADSLAETLAGEVAYPLAQIPLDGAGVPLALGMGEVAAEVAAVPALSFGDFTERYPGA